MENQLRNYGETIKAQLEECEKNYNQKKISPIVEVFINFYLIYGKIEKIIKNSIYFIFFIENQKRK